MKFVVVNALAETCERLFEAGRAYEREMCIQFLREMAQIIPSEHILPRECEAAVLRALDSLADSIEALEHLDGEEDEETLQ